MNTKSRVRAIRLKDKVQKAPGVAESLGLEVTIIDRKMAAKEAVSVSNNGGQNNEEN